jgi:exonuclease III
MRTGLKRFILGQSSKTDIFCFQEVSPTLFQLFKSWLPGYLSFYEKGRILAVDGQIYGQAIFAKHPFRFEEKGRVKLYNQLSNDIGFLQCALLSFDSHKLWLGNIHGKTNPGDKKDTEIRIEQSQKIINFFKRSKFPVIFGGDFNLLPETKSIKLFEEAGYKNLIKDFDIKSTRNRVSWEQFKNKPGFTKQYFADYVFVSKKVRVKDFIVPHIEISDHLPQILDFEV